MTYRLRKRMTEQAETKYERRYWQYRYDWRQIHLDEFQSYQ